MAKAVPIDQQLSALGALRGDPKSEAARTLLTKSLESKSNLVVARAATIINESQQLEFLPALSSAFDRFFIEGTDKGCPAKTALANAMYSLGHDQSSGFLRGIHHVQKEASFGPPVDVAAELRGLCALGLARMGYADILLELAELLVDAEFQPRVMAVRAVAYTGSEDGTPLLRMKLLAGDSEPEVTAECFLALMKLSPKKSLGFVARFLDSSDPAWVEAAAQAIGGSRTSQAFELLQSKWESQPQAEPRRPLLLGIAMTRQPAAVEFMLERVADDRPAPAVDAISAMAIYKHDSTVREKMQRLISERGESMLNAAFQKAFG